MKGSEWQMTDGEGGGGWRKEGWLACDASTGLRRGITGGEYIYEQDEMFATSRVVKPVRKSYSE